jgi:hypothetical protein
MSASSAPEKKVTDKPFIALNKKNIQGSWATISNTRLPIFNTTPIRKEVLAPNRSAITPLEPPQ